MKSGVFKAFTIIFAVSGVIGGIVLGNIYQIPKLVSSSLITTFEFNVGIMITAWVATAILCLIFLGIYYILSYLEELGAGANIVESENLPNVPGVPKSDNSEDTRNMWQCPKCYFQNPISDDPECSNCHFKP